MKSEREKVKQYLIDKIEKVKVQISNKADNGNDTEIFDLINILSSFKKHIILYVETAGLFVFSHIK